VEATDLELEPHEHDPFGGATLVREDQDISWRPQRPEHRPSWFWIGTAVLAVALGTGAFVGMRSAATHATTTNTTPANNFPPAFGPPGGGGGRGPGFGPPPDQQQQSPQQQQPQQNGSVQ
jgi:hypothetical protein